MKKWYYIAIGVGIAGFIAVVSYTPNVPEIGTTKIMVGRLYKWSYTGASFVTTFNDKPSNISGAKETHVCLAGNDESCFLITIRPGDYTGYFTAFRTRAFGEMMAASGSTITNDDLTAQLAAGFNEVQSISGTNGTTWHLVSIGMEEQQLYLERPWGTIIVKDLLGLKGPSYPDRTYISLPEMPQHLIVQ